MLRVLDLTHFSPLYRDTGNVDWKGPTIVADWEEVSFPITGLSGPGFGRDLSPDRLVGMRSDISDYWGEFVFCS